MLDLHPSPVFYILHAAFSLMPRSPYRLHPSSRFEPGGVLVLHHVGQERPLVAAVRPDKADRVENLPFRMPPGGRVYFPVARYMIGRQEGPLRPEFRPVIRLA